MAKFSLVTSIALKLAGFDQGIAKATKGAKNLADGVKTAGNSMAGALSPITSQLGDLGGEFTGLATGAISAFKKIIVGIKGVSTAFAATGIGLVIIAISTAIAGLVGWMKRTDEGADAMRKAFDIVKAVINTVLTKISFLGSAIVKLFKGDFKGAADDAKQAVTGWGESIKEGVKSANLLNDAQDKLEAFEVDYELKREKINAKIAELEYQAKLAQEDNTMSAQKKLDIVNQLNGAIEEGYQLDRQQKLLSLEVAKQNYAISAQNEDTLKEVNLAQKELVAMDTEHNIKLRSSLRIVKELSKTAKEEVENTKANIEALTGLKPIELSIIPKIDTSGIKLEGIQGPPPEFITPESEVITSATLFEESWASATEAVNDMLSNTAIGSEALYKALGNSIITALKSLSGVLMEGADNFKDYAKNVKAAIKQVIGAFIAEGVAALVTNALETAAMTGPLALILAPALASAAGGLAKTLFNSLIPSFHTGGIVGGVGEVPAILKPGEMILTAGQQKNLFDMINGGGVGGGNVVFEIQGDKLVGVLSNYNRRSNSYR